MCKICDIYSIYNIPLLRYFMSYLFLLGELERSCFYLSTFIEMSTVM